MNWNYAAVAPEMVLAGTGLLLLLLEPFVPVGRQRALGWLAIAGVLGALWATAVEAATRGPQLQAMIMLDGTTTFFRVVFLVAALVVGLTAFDFVQSRGASIGEFMALLLFATVGADMMAASWDVVSLYVGLETLSISGYCLASFLRDDARSTEAGLKLFLNGALATAVLLFGLSLAYGVSGTTSIPGMARGLVRAAAGPLAPVALLALGFVLGALAFKIAAVPFHLWAPDAYQGSPTPFAGYLAAVSEAAGFAAILRIVVTGMAPLAGAWSIWLAVLACLSMTVGNVTALWQTSVKRMMAYSSVAQMGYVLAGVAVVTREGVQSVLFYLLAYLFMTLGVFAVISLLQANGQGDDLADFAGLARRAPWLAVLLTVFLASLIGIPATAGFMGKLGLFAATVSGGMTWLAVAVALNSAISVGYYWGVARRVWLEPAPEAAPALRPSPAMGLGLLVAVAGVFALGIVPNVFFTFASWGSFVPGH